MIDWLFTPLAWLFGRRTDWRDAFGRLLLKMGKRFFVVLGMVCAAAGAWDQFVRPFSPTLQNSSFDWLMKHRPIAYAADEQIAVLDIDEASLAQMAPEFGRWPWPREVLARVAGELERSGAQAIVFDILFADPDVRNPESEAAFDRYVQGSRRSFYPTLRLNPQVDSQSRITLAMLNFATRDESATPADGERTIAVLPPYLRSIYDSTRTGTHNIYSDEDNVVRWYPNYELLAGYRIPSLPYRMAQLLHWPLQAQPRSLINWPRSARPYATIPFHEAYRAALNNDGAFLGQFSGKIVLIGSTAPSLNDLKATPIQSLHPGIYVLANAIDNTKRNRFLRPLAPVTVWAIELLLLAGAVHLFVNTQQALTVAKYFFILPTTLLGISLLSVSVSDLLVDLSVPAAIVLTFFTLAKLYDTQCRDFFAGCGVFTPTAAEIESTRLQVACLPHALTRDEVLGALRNNMGAKLWEPPPIGLGKEWASQGWILWRRIARDAAPARTDSDRAAAGRDLEWVDVPMQPSAGAGAETQAGAETAYSLAQAISAAHASKPSQYQTRPQRVEVQ